MAARSDAARAAARPGALVVPPARARAPGDPRLSLVVPTRNEAAHDRGLPGGRHRPCSTACCPASLRADRRRRRQPRRDLGAGARAARRASRRCACCAAWARAGSPARSCAAGSSPVRRVLGVIDADLQHPPEVCARLWAEMARGADLAVASRHVPGRRRQRVEPAPARRSRAARRSLGPAGAAGAASARVSDPMSGFFFVRRSRASSRRRAAARRLQDPDRGARPRPRALDLGDGLRVPRARRPAPAR